MIKVWEATPYSGRAWAAGAPIAATQASVAAQLISVDRITPSNPGRLPKVVVAPQLPARESIVPPEGEQLRALTKLRSIAIGVALVASAALPAAAAGYAGDRDPGFGDRGLVFGGEGAFDDVLAEPSGRVVAAGQGAPFLTGTLYGFTADGTRDVGFGGVSASGSTQIGNVRSMRSVIELSDGRLVVAALQHAGAAPMVVLAGLSAAGVPDASFNGSGLAFVDLGAGVTDVDLALGPGGEIVIGAASQSGLVVARRLADGSPDPTFAAGGSGIAPVGAMGEASVSVLAGGGVLIGGSALAAGASRAAVARFDAGGALDPGFSGDGIAEPVPGDAQVNDLTRDGEGRALLAASVAGEPVAFRLTGSGELDPAFAGDGGAEGPGKAGYEAVTLQPDGAPLLAGEDFSVTRLRADGSSDDSFGRRGLARVSLTGTDFAEANAIAVQPDGAILVAGGSGSTSFRGDYERPTLMRLLAGGATRDADADGFSDRRDRCRFDPGGKKHRGCPYVSRRLDLKRVDAGFKGRLAAAGSAECVRRSKVALLIKRPGNDRVAARQRLGDHNAGKFEFELNGPPGDYYVRTKSRVIFGLGLCGPARSRTVALARP